MTIISRRALAGLSLGLLAPAASAQRRRRVVVRRNTVVVRPGHPVRRAATRTVIVRPARRAVVVGAPLVFLPAIAFAATVAVVTLPPRDRLHWQDTETIHDDEDWVESNFGVDDRGDAMFLDIDGRAQLDFADITYDNGEVQAIDFNEHTYDRGVRKLIDFPGRRHVKTVRLVARSKSKETTFRLYLSA
jgi:hypothetical protein